MNIVSAPLVLQKQKPPCDLWFKKNSNKNLLKGNITWRVEYTQYKQVLVLKWFDQLYMLDMQNSQFALK